MLFNSIEFFVFLPIVYLLYWFGLNKTIKAQNIFLLLASYFFYSWWDWRFLFFLILSTLIDYYFGAIVHTAIGKRKKVYLWLSVLNNLVILGFFKYYNFFADSFKDASEQLGFQVHPYILDIALPVGISFYTFHGMSYVFDIYREKTKPISNFIDYAVFVCFFPLLVAGPIERATHLLPQVQEKRRFNYRQSVEGLRLMLWGFFKKVVIADSLASVVDEIWLKHHTHSGSTLVLGAVYFAFQIYCDFSGYTDIAIGIAKTFGFELLSNFRFPYFSRNIGEFWRRWHISLSSWFKDYLYIPLGGSRGGKLKAIRNTFIIFLVSGFWHGANWTFIVWGGIHAVLFIPLLIAKKNREHVGDVVAEHTKTPSLKELLQMTSTFIMVTFAWIFFRSEDLSIAASYISHLANGITKLPSLGTLLAGMPYIFILILLDWQFRHSERSVMQFSNRYLRWTLYILLFLSVIFFFPKNDGNTFIYFQF